MEGSSDRPCCLSNLRVDDQPALFGLGQGRDLVKFHHQFLVEFMPSCGVDDDEISRCRGFKPVPDDGRCVFGLGFTVDLNGRSFEQLTQLCIGSRPVNVGLDDRHAHAVLLAVPLGQFRRRSGLSLAVETNEKEGVAVRSEFRGRPEQTHQFGVEDVHRVGLKGDARPRFLLAHP